jgi:hypothetical protein
MRRGLTAGIRRGSGEKKVARRETSGSDPDSSFELFWSAVTCHRFVFAATCRSVLFSVYAP